MVWLKAGGVVNRNTGARKSAAKRLMCKRFMERTPWLKCLERRHGPANRASRDFRSKRIQQATSTATNRFDRVFERNYRAPNHSAAGVFFDNAGDIARSERLTECGWRTQHGERAKKAGCREAATAATFCIPHNLDPLRRNAHRFVTIPLTKFVLVYQTSRRQSKG